MAPPCSQDMSEENEAHGQAHRRSTRRVATPELPQTDQIVYVRADTLAAGQWRKLNLSPRTGWVVGRVGQNVPASSNRAATFSGA